jgi:DNA helicase-2/ATP-dependent DNA helicase PcrA
MLTGEQAETIEEPDEHKLICALPGSGKTHTFISFVDVILDKEPTNTVLMMTFINASAKEMEQRVSDRLGKQKAKRVTAATFASLMLRQFKPIAGRRGSVIGPEQYTFVKRALAQANVSYEDIDEWMSVIDNLGRDLNFENNDTPADRVFAAYCDILHRYNRYDINMMTRELINGIESGTIQAYDFSHILCDEFQDTDILQYKWLAAHGKKGKRLAVVGDDDQSIYSFRGSLGYKAFVNFQQDFEAAGYLLSLCFRCKGNILHSARGLIENNSDRIPKKMRSIKEGEGSVKIISIPKGFISQYTIKLMEADTPEALVKMMEKKNSHKKGKGREKEGNQESFRFVTQRIKESEKKGWAVLCRTNMHLDSIESAFSEIGVDTVRIGGKSIFDNEHAIGIISLFAGVVNRSSLNELITGLGWTGEPEVKLHDIYVKSQLYGFAGAQSSGKFYTKPTEFFQDLSSKAASITDKNADKFIAKFFQGVQRVIAINKDPQEKLQIAVSKLCENILIGVKGPLKDRANALTKRSQKNQSTKDIKNPDVVVLSTLNGSKGLEFPRVWIAEVETKKIPLIKEYSIEALEEERRLLYVGMTRAEDELYLSHKEGKESEFIEEIQAQHCA